MSIRVGWLPTGTETAEDARNAGQAGYTQAGLNLARAGIVPGVGTAVPFALTTTGALSCSVGPGQAVIAPGATGAQGAYPVTVDATGSGLPSVGFNAGSALARIDVVYLEVQDTAEDASGFTRGVVGVQQGTSGGGAPAVPAGTLALWNVPVGPSATSITFSAATAVAPATVALGGVVPAAGAGQPAAAYRGQVRARSDLTFTNAYGPLEVHDGTAWQPAVPALSAWQTPALNTGWVTGPASGTVQPIRYRLVYPPGALEPMVQIVGAFHQASASPSTPIWTMPAGYYNTTEDQRAGAVNLFGSTVSATLFIMTAAGAVTLLPNPGNGADCYVDLMFPLS